MKTRSEVYESLKPLLQAFEEERLAIIAKTKNYAYAFTASLYVFIASLVIFPVIPIFTDTFQFLYPMMVGVAAIICLYNFTFGHGLRRQYYQSYKNKLITAIVQAINPELVYRKGNYVSINEFVNSQIFDRDVDCYRGGNWLKGQLGDTDFECSEIHAEYEKVTEYDEGNKTRSYHTIFKGIFMKADFHKHFSGQTFVLTDQIEKNLGTHLGTTLQSASNKGCLAYMENVDFEKEFVVYSSDEIEARYILSINMLERILELKRKFNCDVQLSFIDSSVYIAIPSYNILELDIMESLLNQKVVYKIYEELKMCFDIIEDLNLNTRIWSKQVAINS